MVTAPIVEEPGISLNALSGTPSSNTIRLVGRIGNKNVVILIGSGSTHNFLDHSIAHKTILHVDYNMHLSVKIANEEVINSDGFCDEVNDKLQGISFRPLFMCYLLGVVMLYWV